MLDQLRVMRNQRGFQLISQSPIDIKQQKNVNAIYIVPCTLLFSHFQYWLFFHVEIAGEAGVRCAWPVQHLQRLRIPITGKMAKLRLLQSYKNRSFIGSELLFWYIRLYSRSLHTRIYKVCEYVLMESTRLAVRRRHSGYKLTARRKE